MTNVRMFELPDPLREWFEKVSGCKEDEIEAVLVLRRNPDGLDRARAAIDFYNPKNEHQTLSGLEGDQERELKRCCRMDKESCKGDIEVNDNDGDVKCVHLDCHELEFEKGKGAPAGVFEATDVIPITYIPLKKCFVMRIAGMLLTTGC